MNKYDIYEANKAQQPANTCNIILHYYMMGYNEKKKAKKMAKLFLNLGKNVCCLLQYNMMSNVYVVYVVYFNI